MLTLITALALAGAPIDPVNEQHVAAGATTLVHIDYSHAAATELGRYLLDHLAEADDGDFVAEFTTEMGIEFGEDIRSMTIYSGGPMLGASARHGELSVGAEGTKETVLLIYGSEALEQWDDALAEAREGVEPATLDGRPVRVIDEDEGWLATMLPREGGRLWVVAGGLDRLAAAVGVIDGRGERADLEAWPVAAPAEGAFVYVGVRDFGELEEWEPASDVAKRTEGFALSIGQKGERGFARMQVTASEEEDAEAIVGVCQGVIGLARLTMSKSEEMRPLLRLLGRIAITTDGRMIEASLEQDAGALCETLKMLDDDEDEDADLDDDEDEEEEDDAGERARRGGGRV